jgi:hypothetical protein
MRRLHGLAAQWVTDKRFPSCLRPARRGFAQAGLRLRHPTACSDLQPKWSLVNCDTVSPGEEIIVEFQMGLVSFCRGRCVILDK